MSEPNKAAKHKKKSTKSGEDYLGGRLSNQSSRSASDNEGETPVRAPSRTHSGSKKKKVQIETQTTKEIPALQVHIAEPDKPQERTAFKNTKRTKSAKCTRERVGSENDRSRRSRATTGPSRTRGSSAPASSEPKKKDPAEFESLTDSEIEKILADFENRVETLQTEKKDLEYSLKQVQQQVNQLTAFFSNFPPEGGSNSQGTQQPIKVPITTRPQTPLSNRTLNPREELVMAFLISEQDIERNVKILQEVYFRPLSSKIAMIAKGREDEFNNLFSPLLPLFELFSKDSLYVLLLERVMEWEKVPNLGDTIEKWLQEPKTLTAYLTFAHSFNKKKTDMKKFFEENPILKKELDSIDEAVRLNAGLDLEFLFRQPIDRMKGIGITITKLLGETDCDHEDYDLLGSARDVAQKYCGQILGKVEASTQSSAFSEIAARGNGFDRLLREPPCWRLVKGETEEDEIQVRVLLKQGKIANIIDYTDPKRHARKKVNDFELLLFNDILVASLFVNKTNPYQDFYQPTDSMSISVLDQATLKKKFPKTEIQDEYVLSIQGPENLWLLVFKTSEERVTWLKAMKAIGSTDREQFLSTGTYQFTDRKLERGLYRGEWLRGNPHGAGTLTYPTKSFTGHWNSESQSGFGNATINSKPISHCCGWKIVNGQTIKVIPEFWESPKVTEMDWKLIMAGSELITKQKDSIIIEKGKQNTKLIFLKNGSIKIERQKGSKPIILLPGIDSVIGDFDVVDQHSSTVSVYANEDNTKYEEISINLLSNLLRTNHAVSMRFYRDVAKKLAGALRQFTSASPSIPRRNSIVVPSKLLTSTPPSAEAKRFGLLDTDTVLLCVKCVLKEKISKPGFLYVFSSVVVFEMKQKSFGLSTAVPIHLAKLKKITFDDKHGILKLDKHVLGEISIQDFKKLHAELQPLIEEAQSKGKKNVGVSRAELTSSKISPSPHLSLNAADMGLLRDGAIEKKYLQGDVIILEGSIVQPRLFHIVSGTCTVQMIVEGSPVDIATMLEGAMFGELSFLEESEKPTVTASVLAETDVTVHVLEGWLINSLFVDDPSLGGKFYHHLCSIISKRLYQRETESA